MPIDFSKTLIIGISTRSLFDLEHENNLFEQDGLEAYQKYQIQNENIPPKKGTAFPLIEGLLKLNQRQKPDQPPLFEVIILSRNNASMGIRIFNAIKEYQLPITRAAFTSGESLSKYLKAFNVDLFLSKNTDDVKKAINSEIAAALIQEIPLEQSVDQDIIRIAFDGDAVLFSPESEIIFKEKGLDAFIEHEEKNATKPLPEGPFSKLLSSLARVQGEFPANECPIRLALFTARNAPSHERVIRTLRTWGISMDDAFFLGGLPKAPFLQAYHAHIYFEDQKVYLDEAKKSTPAGEVLWKDTL